MRVLLSDFIAKKDGFSSLDYLDQAKYLAYFYGKIKQDPIFTTRNIKDYFELADIAQPKNVTDLCRNLAAKKIFIPAGGGYKLHRDTFYELEGEFSDEKPKQKISNKLRELVSKTSQEDNRNFLIEAISCYEIKAYRAAVIMTWLLVIDNLYEYIFATKLEEFNGALGSQNLKIKVIVSKEDFGELKEVKFIELCRAANILSNDVKKILEEKLGIRNTCAHPNNIVVAESKATSFIEDLIDNVLLRFHK
jgi:hypothetical protein